MGMVCADQARTALRGPKAGRKGDAEALAAEVRRKILLGQFPWQRAERGRDVPRFAEYARGYLETYAKTACKHTTYVGYRHIIEKHLLPVWEGKRLDQITRADVKRLLLQKQRDGFKPATVENFKALISGLFTHAYEDELLDFNPALKLGRYIQKTDRRRHVNPLTREGASRFLATAREHYPDYYPLLLCAFRTGMRLGELLGLAWEDVDSVAMTLTVRRSYTYGRFTTPKSHRSRVVDMSDQLARTLLAHRQQLLVRFRGRLRPVRAPGGPRGPEDVHLAFPSQTGGPLNGDNFRSRVFYRLLEEADVPRFRFHDIRHTFASLLLQNGESLHYVKEQMGHASIQTTCDVYGHLVPGANRNAVNRLDDDEPPLRIVKPAVG